MPENDPQNLSFYWSTTFVRALYEQGITEVVISPGSRSTPLTLAFAAHPGFRKHISIDERSAAFIALGLAKSSGKPAALVCTSGTAVANYYPAVIEATQSNIPMIILTGDRPPHLRGLGASQTIDQLKIFGDYPVFFHEVGEPKESNQNLLRLELAARQAVQKSITNQGVSHLNFPFSKPFEPEKSFLEVVETENEKLAKAKYSIQIPDPKPVSLKKETWKNIGAAKSPLFIAGSEINHALGNSVSELAKAINAPILVEPGSNIPASKHTIIGFDGFLRNYEVIEELTPDLILRFGRDPVSKALNNYLLHNSNIQQLRFVENDDLFDEPLTAHEFIQVLDSFEVEDIKSSSNKEWIRSWRRHQKEYFAFKETLMFPTTPLTDGYVFHHLADRIPSRSFTMLSNSFPIRDMALFGEYDGKEMYVNRGTAGIDGIISTTIGLSKSLKKPGVLFIGDIAFLHDSNALISLNEIEEPLLIFVLNNGGGTIFKMLPINNYKKKYAQYFETPHNVSLAALCRAHKIGHTLIIRPEQVISQFEKYIEKPGVQILECLTDGSDSMELRKQLWNYAPDPK